MTEAFIAYFDLLGFKEFILNNDTNHIYRRMGHVMRDIELALGQGNYQKPRNGIVLADLSNTRLNCINVSDTIIFWTNDTEIESLDELIQVADKFNWSMNLYNFPLRGCVLKGFVSYEGNSSRNNTGALYSVSSLVGSAIVHAYIKTENQDWAGTVIDNRVFEEFSSIKEAERYFNQHAVKYMVPYKLPPLDQQEEYVFMYAKNSKLDDITYANTVKMITEVFALDNKPFDHPGTKRKLENTILFLDMFR